MKYKEMGLRLASSKQMGQYVLFGTKETITAYIIRSFDGFNPDEIEYMGSITNNGDMTWDQAYDQLIGAPSGFPSFERAIKTRPEMIAQADKKAKAMMEWMKTQ